MGRPNDNFSIFLETIKQQPASPQQQQQAAPLPTVSGTAVQKILAAVKANAGIQMDELFKAAALDFNEFAESKMRLEKLGGIVVQKLASGERVFPGPNWEEVASLLK